MDTKALRRAGLDYHESALVTIHDNLTDCLNHLINQMPDDNNCRVFAATTKGSRPYHEIAYKTGDVLIFGPETRGLPDEVLDDDRIQERIRIPMLAQSRSLNLSNAVAIVAYEVLRQLDYPDLD